MSREIKFRFFSNIEKKMYNDLTLIGLNTTCSEYDDPPVYNPSSVVKEDGGTRVQYYSDGHLMQFSGLLDKTGKEIYDGDIIDHYATYGTVIFEDGMFTLDKSARVNFGYRQPLCYIDTTECEVIGDIHSNPKLLKGGSHNE